LLQYLQQLTQGNQLALQQLVLHFSPSLHRFAYSITGNEQEAEEVVSDVFVNLWRQRQQLPAAGVLKYYLYKAVRHTSVNPIKRNTQGSRRAHRWEVLVTPRAAAPPEDCLTTNARLSFIKEAI